jgi:HAD superfamily hydrolase (TIGR01509 family)
MNHTPTAGHISAAELMRTRTTPLRLVIFDCDGVLIDSEPIASREVASAMTDLGWQMNADEAAAQFLGMSFTDMIPIIAARTGAPLPADWEQQFLKGFLARIAREGTAIPGALEAIDAIEAMGLPWRVASNSRHEEMAVKFQTIGFSHRVTGRLHSYTDVPRAKPAPDLYLAAAAAQGVAPGECVVIEDSPTGARAAIAAGMDCLGFDPHGDGALLAAVGAAPFTAMADLPALIGSALR